MKLPNGWTTERLEGNWNLYRLVHRTCEWRSVLAYDPYEDRADIDVIVHAHRCK